MLHCGISEAWLGFSGSDVESDAVTQVREKAVPIGRREKNKREKRRRIIAAAKKLFKRLGYRETTTQQIAEEADIATGTLFLYAKTKEDLLLMVFKDEMMETAIESFENLPRGAGPVEQLMTVFERMVIYHERDFDLSRTIHRQIFVPSDGARDEDLTELTGAIYAGISNVLKAAQAKGRIRADLPADAFGEIVFATYYHGLVGWFGGRFDRDDFLAHTRRQLMALLGVRQTQA